VVHRHYHDVLYLQNVIKFQGTSRSAKFICALKSRTVVSALIFMKLSNTKQDCVQISCIEICLNGSVKVEDRARDSLTPKIRYRFHLAEFVKEGGIFVVISSTYSYTNRTKAVEDASIISFTLLT
jgi:hypothetical protein